ncbi:MAG: calycin-like domain-containing protein [Prevotellaceae bacterium]|nr:calycin-like domain-containing protein [Prevotellaceae bacterium]
MKKQLILGAAIALMATNVMADDIKITLTDGTVVTYNIDEVAEITFEEGSNAESNYAGTQTVVIGDMFSYTADITVTVTENADGTINVTYPEYSFSGTMMGDLTLGTLTIPNIPFDETKNAYYLDYSSLGLTQHFKAESNGVATMDNDYVLGTTSEITVELTDNSVKITNPFKLGNMPLSLTSSFEGTK